MWPEWAFLKVLGDKHSCKSSRNTCWPLGLTLRLLKLLYGPQSVTAKVKIFVKTWKVNIESFWCNNLFRSAQNDHRTLIWSSSRLINWIGKKRKRIFQRDWREKMESGRLRKNIEVAIAETSPDFMREVGLNLALGLVISICSCQTAWWTPACCWLWWGSMSIGDPS